VDAPSQVNASVTLLEDHRQKRLFPTTMGGGATIKSSKRSADLSCRSAAFRTRQRSSAAQKAIMQRQLDATDAEIDRLVYDLYGLTAEEIALVEGRE
jgi:hypothetical protein